MNPFSKALEEGYSEDELLNFAMNAFPALKKKISGALKTGYSAKEIINFISNLLGKTQKEVKSSSNMTQQSVHAQQMRQDEMKQEQLLKTGASLAGGAVAGRALQSAVPQISGLLSKRGLPKAPGQQAPKAISAPTGQITQAIPTNTTQATSVAPAAANAAVGPSSQDLIKQMGLDTKIDNLVQNNPPEVVSQAVKGILTPGQKTWLKSQTDQPIEEIVNEYITQNKPEEKPQKMALLPDGEIGKVVDERQGITTLEAEDGKTSNFKTDDLLEDPDEIITAVKDILKIPEAARSAPIAWTSYSPESKKLYVMFHSGKTVEYDDFSEEEFNDISQGKHSAKTTGGNIYGIWSPEDEEKSRGATFHNLIRTNPKYAKENEGKTWRYLQEGYDYWNRLRKRPKKKRSF